MKKVFSSNSDLIHLFCQFTQNEGRTSNGNVFFVGGTLYSYGYHYELAKLVDGVLWVNTYNYSSSTARHQSILRSSINRHAACVNEVQFLDFGARQNVYSYNSKSTFEPIEIFSYHIKNANYWFENWAKSKRGFKDLEQVEYHVKQAGIIKSHSVHGLSTFLPNGLQIFYPKGLNFDYFEFWTELNNRRKKQAQINEASREKREAIERMQQAEKLDLWLRGDYNGSFYGLEKTYLRIKGREVQTTKGARVHLSEALELLRDIRAGRDVVGRKIGSFTVNAVTLDNVVIGCHTLNWDVINATFPN